MEKYFLQLNNLFSQHDEIKLVYLFGSQATKKTTPLSDFDFAIYLDEKTPQDIIFNIKLEILAALALILKSDKVDLVILNDRLDPLLKYEIISQRKILYEREPFRIEIEPKIFSEYFDFYTFLDNKSHD